jgi:hypothetical protein
LAKILAENMACKRRIDALKAQIAEDRRVIGDALEFLARHKRLPTGYSFRRD